MSDAELETRETFLRAIFDSPDDPTPRLIYADWLEERGDEAANQFRNVINLNKDVSIEFDSTSLLESHFFREVSVSTHTHWFGARSVLLRKIVIDNDSIFDVLLCSPASRLVTSLVADSFNYDMSNAPLGSFHVYGGPYQDTVFRPVITMKAIEILARHRLASRLKRLDLRYNELGNDAARAIARSAFFDNLESLQLMTGNRIRGRVWQEIVERFGEDVVS